MWSVKEWNINTFHDWFQCLFKRNKERRKERKKEDRNEGGREAGGEREKQKRERKKMRLVAYCCKKSLCGRM